MLLQLPSTATFDAPIPIDEKLAMRSSTKYADGTRTGTASTSDVIRSLLPADAAAAVPNARDPYGFGKQVRPVIIHMTFVMFFFLF